MLRNNIFKLHTVMENNRKENLIKVDLRGYTVLKTYLSINAGRKDRLLNFCRLLMLDQKNEYEKKYLTN